LMKIFMPFDRRKVCKAPDRSNRFGGFNRSSPGAA
jgi:hypothetical protein